MLMLGIHYDNLYSIFYFYFFKFNTAGPKYLFNHLKITACWIKNSTLESRMYFYFYSVIIEYREQDLKLICFYI